MRGNDDVDDDDEDDDDNGNDEHVGDWLVWLVGFLTSSSTIRLYHGRAPRQTILGASTHETELGDHDFCLSRSHYTDTDSTSRKREAGGHSGNRTRDLLTRSRVLCRLSYRAPRMMVMIMMMSMVMMIILGMVTMGMNMIIGMMTIMLMRIIVMMVVVVMEIAFVMAAMTIMHM